MKLDWTVEPVGTSLLVTVDLRNDAPVPRRVRVENRLDAPVSPPRREGVPLSGWSDDGYVGVVPANGRLVLGYACPTDDRVQPPVAIADDRPAESAPDLALVDTAVRRLGDPAPPVDALPSPAPHVAAAEAMDEGTDSSPDAGTRADPDDPVSSPSACDRSLAFPPINPPQPTTVDPPTPTTVDSPTLTDCDRSDASNLPDEASGRPSVACETRPVERVGNRPSAVGPWLDAVERRVSVGERLTDASVVEAADALDDAGGLDAVDGLPDALAADERSLRRLARRADDLADRAAATDVPLDALRRLA